MGLRLFVGNLSFNTDENVLREAFSAHGGVTDVAVIMDRETGRSRGFGFVTMADANGAKAAQQALDGAQMGGRPLRVNEAEERTARSGGGGGGGGFGRGGGDGGYGGGGGGYGGGGGGGGGSRGGGDRKRW